MSKKFSRTPRYDDFQEEDEDFYQNGHRDILKERRKMKRMRNALKSRNVDYLANFDEE
jgi:hypothetical protein